MNSVPVQRLIARPLGPLDMFPVLSPGTRRNPRLRDVFPAVPDFLFAAIITECETSAPDNRRIQSFDDLSPLLRDTGNALTLDDVRSRFSAMEGNLSLPPAVADNLTAMSGAASKLYIRCWYDPDIFVWLVPTERYLSSKDLFKVLPTPVGELEIADDHARWFLRAMDDDPFIFLQASPGVIHSLIELSDRVMEVPGTTLLRGTFAPD